MFFPRAIYSQAAGASSRRLLTAGGVLLLWVCAAALPLQAGCFYKDFFLGDPHVPYQLSGDAAFRVARRGDTNGFIGLTSTNGWSMGAMTLECINPPEESIESFMAALDVSLGGGLGGGLSFCFSPKFPPLFGDNSPRQAEQRGRYAGSGLVTQGLVVSFCAPPPGANQAASAATVSVAYDGTVVASAPAPEFRATPGFIPIWITVATNGVLNVSCDDQRVIRNLALPVFAPEPLWCFGVGARTETKGDHHALDNMAILTGTKKRPLPKITPPTFAAIKRFVEMDIVNPVKQVSAAAPAAANVLPRAKQASPIKTLFTFSKRDDLQGWSLEGPVFQITAQPGLFETPTLNSCSPSSAAAGGRAVSPAFRIGPDDQWLVLEMHGAKPADVPDAALPCARLLDAASGEVLAEVTPDNSPVPHARRINLFNLHDQNVRLDLMAPRPAGKSSWIGLRSVSILGR